MVWRVLLTALYAVVAGALMALDNHGTDIPDAVSVAVLLAAPVVGFLVGRWWAVLAVLGVVVGRSMGWDPAENDGNPALWPPYLIAIFVYVGLPLLAGVGCSHVVRLWKRPWSDIEG